VAVYRQVHTTFWQDPYVLDHLDFKEKYFYLYLMTNSKTTQCGIYEISEGVMRLETGLPASEINQMISKFETDGKIKYSKETKEIFLVNWVKYNPVNNTNIEKCVLKELKELKSDEYREDLIRACISLEYKIPLINKAYEGLIRGLYTPTKKKEQEKEQEKEKEKEEEQEQEKGASVAVVDTNIFNDYAQAGFGIASSVQAEKLMELEKEYGYDWTRDAIKEAAMNNILKISYVDGILKNWKANGRNAKKPIYDKKGKEVKKDFTEREYDYDDLERKLLGWDK
jgi:DnaD/phage-associated family protein